MASPVAGHSSADETDSSSDYFSTNPAPPTLGEHAKLARAFIEKHAAVNRRVALVTSGGTTVPLETETVRFIDNFSAGTRGATSAEYFLREGYAVIFLHRQFSLLPFSRHYSHSTNCFLDFMAETGGESSSEGDTEVIVKKEYQAHMRQVLREYKRAKSEGLLLILPFVSVTDYLFELREIASLMRPLGGNALFYLAAAVSDFFIPRNRMVEHKIQSSGDDSKDNNANPACQTGDNEKPPSNGKKLVINLDPVPKFLHKLVSGWAPKGSTIVSFKLETDATLLVPKAEQALQRYSHHLVIGNTLRSRKWAVLFLSRQRDQEGQERFKHKWIELPRDSKSEIESLIVPELKKLHTEQIESAR